jgi:hypothetical protein
VSIDIVCRANASQTFEVAAVDAVPVEDDDYWHPPTDDEEDLGESNILPKTATAFDNDCDVIDSLTRTSMALAVPNILTPIHTRT